MYKKLSHEQIIRKLKLEFKQENIRRAKYRKLYGGCPDNEPLLDYRTAFAIPYQILNRQFKSSKVVFIPNTCRAYSYGWWRFVDCIKGKVVFNECRYSASTSGHQGAVRKLLSQLGIKIDLKVRMHQSLENFKTVALIDMYKELYNLEVEGRRRGAKDRSKAISALAKDIKIARSLGAQCTRAKMRLIKEKCEQTEEARLERMRLRASKKKKEREGQRMVIESNVVLDLSSIMA